MHDLDGSWYKTDKKGEPEYAVDVKLQASIIADVECTS